jgi:hypothetical protein
MTTEPAPQIERYPDPLGWLHNLRSVVLDDEGLILHHRRGPATRLDWNEVTGLHWVRGGSLELLTAAGTVRLPHSLAHLQELAQHIAAMERERRSPQAAAHAEQVERWLGGFTEARFGSGPRPLRGDWLLFLLGSLLRDLAVILVTLLLAFLTLLMARGPGVSKALEWLGSELSEDIWPMWRGLSPGGGPPLRLSADGRHVALRCAGGFVMLHQDHGPPLRFPRLASVEPVVRCAQRLLAARQGFEGEAAYVPDTALSRAGGESDAEKVSSRALSRAEGERGRSQSSRLDWEPASRS